MKNVLVIGAASQLAFALIRQAPAAWHCTGLSRVELDITDAPALEIAIESAQPELVINCAAYNLVDRAEVEGLDRAFEVNAVGAARVATCCHRAGVALLHFSTDFVFDGLQHSPYTETSGTAPINAYGASKLAGENLVLAASPANLVVRVSRLFGPGGSRTGKAAANFPMLMLRLAAMQPSVKVVDDQVGAPTYTMDLAGAVWQLAAVGAQGLYHVTNEGHASFDEIALEVFRNAEIKCRVEPVSSLEYGARARRPAYSVLHCGKAWQAGVTPLRNWKDAMTEFIVSGEAAV